MLNLKNYKLLLIIIFVALTTSGCITVKTGSQKTANTGGYGGVFKSINKGTNWTLKSSIASASGKPQTISGLNISCFAMDPNDNSALYYGSEGNGLFYSYDGAETWQYAKSLGAGTIKAVAVDPENKCAIYSSIGNKIFKSIDCSRTWQQIYFDNDARMTIGAIAVDHYDSRIVYAGISRGDIIKSSDGGGSWQTVARFKNRIDSILIDPNDSRNVYITVNQKSIFRLADNGEEWKDLNNSLKDFKLGQNIKTIKIASSSAAAIFVATDKGIIKSLDKGTTWEQLKLIPPEKSAAINDIAINSSDIKEVYYVTNSTFYRSVDGGENWTTIKMPTVRQGMKLLIDPVSPSIIYMGVWAPPQK